jgi:colanic acid/amylovoran biosynthesis glycosyltransferase
MPACVQSLTGGRHRTQPDMAPPQSPEKSSSLLLVLPPLLFKDAAGNLHFERQACNGLARWAEHFATVTVMCPLSSLPEPQSGELLTTSPVATIEHVARIRFIPLPLAFKFGAFFQCLPEASQQIRQAIDQNQYLSFAIGGLWGDWGAVACMIAARQSRPYSVWTDRVEHRVVALDAHTLLRGSVLQKLKGMKWWLRSRGMKILERHVISRAALGLFHGADCHDEYSKLCKQSELVHDIHLKTQDLITEAELTERLKRFDAPDRVFNLVYAGRVTAMKGPFHWIEAMHVLAKRGVRFTATWFGDGPDLEAARQTVSRLNIDQQVFFPGAVTDRAVLMHSLREAHALVFCHLTPESPRILIEALMSGLPIVGYESAYPRDLLASRTLAAQLLTPQSPTALADQLVTLAANPESLVDASKVCAELGSHYSDTAVFKHRSDLIKAHL